MLHNQWRLTVTVKYFEYAQSMQDIVKKAHHQISLAKAARPILMVVSEERRDQILEEFRERDAHRAGEGT